MVEIVFHDAPIMVDVIRCESQFIHYKPDGTVLVGRVDNDDVGLGQVNKRYHPKVESEDFWKNLAYVRELYDRNGMQDYTASQGCWQKHIALLN